MSRVFGAVNLRPVAAGDGPFLERLYASTRERELEHAGFGPEQMQSFLAQQFAAQSSHYERQFPDASFDVVLVAEQPIGRLIVDRRGEAITIVDIALLPEYRSRGIGTSLLVPLLEEADAGGAVVSIHVERTNPALRFYERLGFAVTSDDGVYLTLERVPGGGQEKTAS